MPLKDEFARIYANSIQKGIRLEEVGECLGQVWKWDLEWRKT